jgi:23S rRNA (guanine745-N1)-methyltransferase
VPPEARFIADIAAGTGYYLAAALEARPRARGIALDVSSPAARRAVRAHACAAAATADAWKRLPIADGTVDAALTVFGPRNGQELVRVLTPDGVAIVVTPNASHMTELRERFGLIGIQHDKDARLESQFAGLRLVGREPVDYDIQLTPEDAANEIFMGPSAFHLDRDAVTEQLGDTTSRVTVSVTVSVFSA